MALVAAAVAGTSPAAASALTPPPGFSDLGEGGGPHSDGLRWIAFARPESRAEVIDTATGSTRTLEPPQYCTPTAVGTVELVMTCPGEPGGNQQHLLAGLLTGELATAEPIARRIRERPGGASGLLSARYTDVGRHWLRVESTYYHDFRWDDMYRRSDGLDFPADDPGARRNPDPDARSGSIPLCRPLHRRIGPQGFDEWPQYAPYQFERPYGLSTERRGGLVLDRCGSKSKRLSRDPDVVSPQLGGRYVTWSEASGEVHLYDIRKRRSHVMRFAGATRRYLSVAHTRTHIAVADDALYPPERHVYLARIADVARR